MAVQSPGGTWTSSRPQTPGRNPPRGSTPRCRSSRPSSSRRRDARRPSTGRACSSPSWLRDGPRVVAITAPPGYGKTTLLAQWLAHEPRPVAWLTVDDLDNDPAVLLSYLAAAFDRILPVEASIRSALSAPHERILTTAVPRLLTALDGWHRPAALVVDDVHRLVDRTSLDALTALLDHLPPSFRVVIAGRSEPDLGLARRRAAGDLLEIGTDLLALTDTETAAIAEAHGHPLRREEARELTARTEGWVAGVHLAALDQSKAGAGAGPLGDVSGRDRYIAAYFRSEFQRDLADADLAVLTRTSILETVTASSAVAVSGIPDAWERLEAVARASLLVQELGTVGTVYRYHQLLRDFLQGELDRREPDARQDLERRAAAWHLAARDLDRAVSHAIASGDRHLAAMTVTAASLPTFYGGHPATVDRWIRSFDVADFERNPPLAVIAGWLHLLNGRGDAADRVAGIADRSVFDDPPGDGSASFESQRAMLRAVMGRRGPEDVLANARLAASQERADSPWRTNALWLLGSGRLLVGDVEAADAAFAEAIEDGPGGGGPVMVAMAKLAGIAMRRGDWTAADEFVQMSRDELAVSNLGGDPAVAPRPCRRGAGRHPPGRPRSRERGPGPGAAPSPARVARRAMVRGGRPPRGRPGLPGAVRPGGRAGGPPGGGADRPPPPRARRPGGRADRDATPAR